METILGMVVMVIIITVWVMVPSSKQRKEREELILKNNAIRQAHLQKYNIPTDAHKVTMFNDFTESNGTSCYLWIDRNILKIIPNEHSTNASNIQQINISNIKYFTHKGDFYTETKVSGGGGGGSSLKGAVIGGVIAGGAGAVIGSRKKIGPIKTENKVVDKRKTIVEYRTVQNPKKFIFLNSETYNVLMKEIPQKERNLI